MNPPYPQGTPQQPGRPAPGPQPVRPASGPQPARPAPPAHPLPQAPQADLVELEPSEPPSLLELMELTLRAPLSPEGVFAGCARLPAPGLGVLLLNALFWTGVGCLLNALFVMMRLPATAGLGAVPLLMALGGLAVAAVPATFVGAGLVHLLALLSGGGQGFTRSYQAFSLLGVLAPVWAVTVWLPVPYAALAPTLLGAFLCARAIAALHQAPPTQAFVVVGALGFVLCLGEAAAQSAISRLQRDVEMFANLYATGGGPASGTAPAVAASAGPAEEVLPPTPEQAQQMAASAQDLATAANQLAQSSLQMIQGPSGGPGLAGGQPMGPGGEPGGMPAPGQVEGVRDMTLNVLDMANKQFGPSSANAQHMTPQQRAQMEQLMNMANQIGSQLKGGDGKMDPGKAEQALKQVMEMMNGEQQAQPGRRAPSRRAPSRRQRRAQPPPEEETFEGVAEE